MVLIELHQKMYPSIVEIARSDTRDWYHSDIGQNCAIEKNNYSQANFVRHVLNRDTITSAMVASSNRMRKESSGYSELQYQYWT